jgi:poly(3-hydroxybutyrate) depolymerase
LSNANARIVAESEDGRLTALVGSKPNQFVVVLTSAVKANNLMELDSFDQWVSKKKMEGSYKKGNPWFEFNLETTKLKFQPKQGEYYFLEVYTPRANKVPLLIKISEGKNGVQMMAWKPPERDSFKVIRPPVDSIPQYIRASDLTSLSPGKNEIQIEHDGRSRRLIVHTPKTFDRQVVYPILFCFHGAGGKADGPSERFSPHVNKHGLIVISAEAVRPLGKWNFKEDFHAVNHDDIGFISKVVEILVEQKIADHKAIYATGHSSGGLFCYRLAKETDLFAAVSPMSCGMAKGAHDPDKKTKPISIMQVIGDQDKSFNGSSDEKVTMYSARKRIDIWRTFNRCHPDPVVVEKGEEVVLYTYANAAGVEVVFCKVKNQGHHIRKDLRDSVDSIAINFLLKHKRM